MKAKIIPLFLILVILLLLAGCKGQVQLQQENGLQIHNLSTAIGAVDSSNSDEQKVSYSFSITNSSNAEVYIKSTEPIVSDPVKEKILSGTTSLDVNKSVQANSTIQLTGELRLNTKGLSKSDIVKLEPMIKGFDVITEQNVYIK